MVWLSLRLVAVQLLLVNTQSVWDYAPDFSNDPILPYPSLINIDGTNISIDNLRGTRLFGYTGCTDERANLIKEAYNDFHTLSNQLSVYNHIVWTDKAATDFFGPGSGPYTIPDNTRKEILQIFQAAQQIYSYPWTWEPPWLSWRQLWIEVRCSDGKKGNGAPDPEDTCGDAEDNEDNEGQCPGGSSPVGEGGNKLQAFSDPVPSDSRYSRITFCNGFFQLQTMTVATENGQRLPATKKIDLSLWDSQARCMFHEITHLDYFMNAGAEDKGLSPFVSDLEVNYKLERDEEGEWFGAYGPYNARILRNWVEKDPQDSGYFTQRNADNYAWFAVANYVENLIGKYPKSPSPGRKKVQERPRDLRTGAAPELSEGGVDGQQIDDDEEDPPADITYPGCGDKIGPEVAAAAIAASISSQYGSPTATATAVPAPGSLGSQQLAIASYIDPLADPDAWTRLVGYSANKVSVLVANVVNGPDSTINTNWKTVIDQAAASGKTVLGYVRTGYLGVSQQQFRTRLGSTNLADWTAQIEQDVDLWYNLYGDSIGGIFFDEGWNDCGPDNVYANLYSHINRYTKSKHAGAFTVVNPGATMPQCFEDSMDTLLTFENSYGAYTTSYVDNGWASSDVRKIWHIIYGVPEDKVSEVAALALSRGAGLVEITNDIQPNPYDNLPADSYLQSQMSAVAGGAPMREAPSSWPSVTGQPTTPGGLSVSATDYSSTHLKWSPAANAIAYKVQLGDTEVAMVTAAMTEVTIGNLAPGTSNSFVVYAVGGGGSTSGGSNAVTAQTLALPGGATVTNTTADAESASTTIQADILVPYAFVRVYIWDTIMCDLSSDPGWPINYADTLYVCTRYMIEGTTLYKYSGTLASGSTNAPWAWTAIDTAPVSVNGYTYTWTLPIGTSTIKTSCFVIQVQGYNPIGNDFVPDPKAMFDPVC